MTLPPPPKKLHQLSGAIRSAVLRQAADTEDSPEIQLWVEKIRRFCSLYGYRLNQVGKQRFADEWGVHSVWFAQVLLSAAKTPQSMNQILDLPALNALLWAVDAIPDYQTERSKLIQHAEECIDRLREWHCDPASLPSFEAEGCEARPSAQTWRNESGKPLKIAILCPNRFSTFTIATLGLLRKYGVRVDAVIYRKITYRRAMQELRRDGLALFVRRVWRKLIVRGDENAVESPLNISRINETLASDIKDVGRYCADNGIDYVQVAEFDDANDWLSPRQFDLALFTGGGITRVEFQRQFRIGVINCHMGLLPQYRGMDVVEAPILERHHAQVGLTTHVMDAGIDTGPVLQKFAIGTDGASSLEQCRNAVSGVMPVALVDTALGLASGRLSPKPQTQTLRQHFFVHPRLREVLVGSAIWSGPPSKRENAWVKTVEELVQW